MRFPSFVWSNLWCRRSRSLLTLAGVAVGVAAGVSMFGVARGFDREILIKYAALDTQMIVTGATKNRPFPSLVDQRIGEELAKMPGVLGVAGALWDVQNVEGATALGVMGWEAGSYLWKHLVLRSGDPLVRQGEQETVYLGQMASGSLRKSEGDSIAFDTDQATVRVFRVAGVFESPSLAENAGAIMRLELLQSLLGCQGKVNYFNLHLDPRMTPQEFEMLRMKIQGRFPELNVLRADEIASNNAGLRAARAMSIATTAIALLIGTLGVTNSVMMSVFERSREIGLLMAVGWKTTRIAAMILMESVFLCLCGAVAGSVAAIAGVTALQNMESFRGRISADFGADLILLAFLVAAGVGLLGGLYPAYLASRHQPCEALRHE